MAPSLGSGSFLHRVNIGTWLSTLRDRLEAFRPTFLQVRGQAPLPAPRRSLSRGTARLRISVPFGVPGWFPGTVRLVSHRFSPMLIDDEIDHSP